MKANEFLGKNVPFSICGPEGNHRRIANIWASQIKPGVPFFARHLRFPNQAVGTTSDLQIVEKTNQGTRSINLQEISVWGDFSQTNDCGKSLAAGQSCLLTVNFTPTEAGFRKGGLRFSTNAPDSPQFLYMVGIGGYEVCPQGVGFYRDGQWFFGGKGDSCGGGNWTGDHVEAFGGYSEDIPLIGDWSGINNPKIGIYRQGLWYLDLNGNGKWGGCYPQGADACFGPFGGYGGDGPLVGDWNGMGKSKVGIYRHGMWYPDLNGNGEWDGCEEDACLGPFGGAENDQPMPGDWTGGGVTQIGFYRNGIWHLTWNGNGKWDGCDIDLCSTTIGGAGNDQPVVK